ncbi:cytochrome P450 [Streptomyces sp. NPDC001978]|uniref:cytochrome P450 n=1 Tax=Streptomyces sp. NPDC001978 TaxID=3364627 RepID=UPI0036B072C5
MPANDPPFYPVPRSCPLHPSEALADLQALSPLTKVQIWNEQPAWLVTRHAELLQLLVDPRLSVNSERQGYPSANLAAAQMREQFPTFLQMDAPEHQILRRMVASDFSVKKSEARRAEIDEIVKDALESLLQLTPPVDFIEEFALVVPSMVIARILGVPYKDHKFFQSRSHTFTSSNSTPEEIRVATGEMREYLTELVTSKNREPGDDLLSRLVVKHMRTGELSLDQVVAHARLLLAGGHDTTASMIGLGMLALLLYPDQRSLLANDRTHMRNAVEEMLRFTTITHIGRRRVATSDISIGEVTIKAGEGVIADAFIGNRDPRVFEDPDSFDIDRDTRAHIAFGYGPHQCIGQNLARVELQVVFNQLLDKIPTMRLAVDFEELRFKESAIIYGLEALPIAW